jgi:GNAT superfamily N-acetyltransferase
LDETAEAVRAYFAERKLPFQIQLRAGEPTAARQLESRGWRRKPDPLPGMALALPASPPALPAGLAVEEVRTPRELAAYGETAFRGFGFPAAGARAFLNERLFAWERVRMYAGLVDGEVVATSMLVATGEVAGIYWVATLAEQRRRGYGEALTWAAVGGGRALGCRVASLQASQLGHPVYARMGFAHVLDYQGFLPPED